MPVVCIAPRDAVFDKMLSNVEQGKTRGGQDLGRFDGQGSADMKRASSGATA